MELAISSKVPLAKLARFRRKKPSKPLKSGLGPIGIDLGRNALRAAQIRFDSDQPVLKSFVVCEYPCERGELLADTKLLRQFVADAFAGKGFKGHKVVTCTPPENLRLLSLEYPIEDAVSEEEAIVSVLRQRIDGDLSDYVIDYVPSRDTGVKGNRSALVALADLNKQIKYLELLRAAGFDVVGMEIGPIAIRRLVENVSRVEQIPNTLVVNCGVANTYLTVTSGRRLMLDRGIKFGEKYLVEKVASALDMSTQDATGLVYDYGLDRSVKHSELVEGVISSQDIVGTIIEVVTPAFQELIREIDKVSAYVRSQLHGADIQQIYLLGSVARWPGADQFLSNHLDRSVKILDPFESFSVDAHSLGDVHTKSTSVAGMALAVGCALSELR